jgi:hypothetical protein
MFKLLLGVWAVMTVEIFLRGGSWSLSSISQARKWFKVVKVSAYRSRRKILVEEMVVKFSQLVIRGDVGCWVLMDA